MHVRTILQALVWTSILGTSVSAQSVQIIEEDAGCAPICCSIPPAESMNQLVRLSKQELECLYRQGTVGAVPSGYVRGKPVFFVGTCLAGPVGRFSRLMWQGKVLEPECGIMRNKLFGLKLVPARIYYGESWLDGGPAIIMDYWDNGGKLAAVRDEIREVAPGLFVGITYLRACPQPKFGIFFVLDARAHGKCRSCCSR